MCWPLKRRPAISPTRARLASPLAINGSGFSVMCTVTLQHNPSRLTWLRSRLLIVRKGRLQTYSKAI
jgi:hypothetical protein